MSSKWKHLPFALLLCAFVVAASCSAPSPAPPGSQIRILDDGDDRPPIIVKNGTIDFLAISVKGGPGYWDPAASTTGPWTLKHDTSVNESKHFNVAVLFGAKEVCKDQAGSPAGFEFKTVQKLTFTNTVDEVATMKMVKNGGDPRTAEVSVLPAGIKGEVKESLLAVGTKGASVKILRVDEKTDGTGKYYTCEFTPDLAMVAVFQKKQ